MKQYLKWIILAILIFHIFITANSFYTFFSDSSKINIYYASPICLLIFSLAWLGIFLKKRWCAFAYFLLILYELAMRMFFHGTAFGDVFGDIMFPMDIVFLGVIVFSYNIYFRKEEE